MHPVPSVGNHETGAKRGKSCIRCHAREILQLVPSAGNCFMLIFFSFVVDYLAQVFDILKTDLKDDVVSFLP